MYEATSHLDAAWHAEALKNQRQPAPEMTRLATDLFYDWQDYKSGKGDLIAIFQYMRLLRAEVEEMRHNGQRFYNERMQNTDNFYMEVLHELLPDSYKQLKLRTTAARVFPENGRSVMGSACVIEALIDQYEKTGFNFASRYNSTDLEGKHALNSIRQQVFLLIQEVKEERARLERDPKAQWDVYGATKTYIHSLDGTYLIPPSMDN